MGQLREGGVEPGELEPNVGHFDRFAFIRLMEHVRCLNSQSPSPELVAKRIREEKVAMEYEKLRDEWERAFNRGYEDFQRGCLPNIVTLPGYSDGYEFAREESMREVEE
jgi:hypothetical protein